METVTHLWNVNQFMTRFKCPLTVELQTFYMQTSKNLKDVVELPKQNFGPSVMCSYCGSLWSTIDYRARVSHGRKMSKSVKKIVQRINKSDQKIPKVCATLVQKSIKNEMNKLVMKCSVCSKKTELPFRKKNRLKPVKLNNSQTETPQSKNRKKKRKKKSKDKTAGLNISSGTPKSLNQKNDSKTPIKLSAITSKISNNKMLASAKKSKKLNIERLKHIVNQNTTTTPTKRKSLHSFLTELC